MFPVLVPLTYEFDSDGVLHARFDRAELKAAVSDPNNKRFLIKDNQGKLLGIGVSDPIRRMLGSQEDSLVSDTNQKPPSEFQDSSPADA